MPWRHPAAAVRRDDTRRGRQVADRLMDVLVAGYQTIDAATKDFDGLMQIVRYKEASIDGAILVARDAEGEVTMQQHGDHRGANGDGVGSRGRPARRTACPAAAGFDRRRRPREL
jgi:hypothetical protein